MLKISQQQALERWDTLPENLREAIFSEQNADILWKICEFQHLTDDKTYKIAALAGDAIMGFIHPEDLSREIVERLGINSQIADVISAEIDRKIFAPIKEDIKKVYAPAPAASWGTDVLNLKVPKPEAEVGVPEKPAVPLPAASEVPAVEIPKPPLPPQPPSAPKITAPPAPAEEAPIIIHEEAKLKPAQSAPARSLGGILGFGFGKKTDEKQFAPPGAGAVAAQVKLGKEPLAPPAPGRAKPPEPPKPERIVHYSEFRTAVSPFGTYEPAVSRAAPLPPAPAKPKIPEPPASFKPAPVIPPAAPKVSDKSVPTPVLNPPVPPPPAPPPAPPPMPTTPPKPPEEKREEGVIDLRTFEIKK